MGWRKHVGFVFLSIITISLSGQTIKVVNQANNSPISEATIQEKETDRGTITDTYGIAILKGFSDTSILIIRHPSFRPREVKFIDLARLKYTITLTEEFFQMDDIVVSANKWEQNKVEIPQRITEFEAKEIALAEPATAADILSMNGQVFVQKRICKLSLV